LADDISDGCRHDQLADFVLYRRDRF
jgi:hypothetical protein